MLFTDEPMESFIPSLSLFDLYCLLQTLIAVAPIDFLITAEAPFGDSGCKQSSGPYGTSAKICRPQYCTIFIKAI